MAYLRELIKSSTQCSEALQKFSTPRLQQQQKMSQWISGLTNLVCGLKLSFQHTLKSCTIAPTSGFQLKCLAISRAYLTYISMICRYLSTTYALGLLGNYNVHTLLRRALICDMQSRMARAAVGESVCSRYLTRGQTMLQAQPCLRGQAVLMAASRVKYYILQVCHSYYIGYMADSLTLLLNVVLAVGLCKVISVAVGLVQRFVLPGYDLYRRYGGGWAVVTGGSDGIGLGFAEELAKLGFNVCVVSRTRAKIDAVCLKLNEINPKIQTKAVVADFTQSFKPGFFEKLMQQLEGLDVSVLVNNVGYLSDPAPFCITPPSQIHKQNTVNLLPSALLSRHLLPRMQARPHRSAMLFLSSFSTSYNIHPSGNYASTKLFNSALAHSLSSQQQYTHKKVDYLSVKPNLVTTAMTRNMNTIWHSSKNECAGGSLRSLGKYGEYAGSAKHELLDWLVGRLGEGVKQAVIGRVWRQTVQSYRDHDSSSAKKQ